MSTFAFFKVFNVAPKRNVFPSISARDFVIYVLFPNILLVYGFAGYSTAALLSDLVGGDVDLVYGVIGVPYLLLLIFFMLRFGFIRNAILVKPDAKVFIVSVILSVALFLISIGIYYTLPIEIDEFLSGIVKSRLPSVTVDPFSGDYSSFWLRLLAIFERVIIAPIHEELLNRGILLWLLCRYAGINISVLFVSVIFSFLHFDVMAAFVFSVVLCIVTLRTHSLQVAVITHISYNIMGVLFSYFNLHPIFIIYFPWGLGYTNSMIDYFLEPSRWGMICLIIGFCMVAVSLKIYCKPKAFNEVQVV